MNWGVILAIIPAVLGALASGLPILYKWNKARKAKNTAVTEADKKQAQIEMLEQANALIMVAEETYTLFDRVMKQQNNSSAGALKKDSVLTKLQAYALSKGYEFDSEYWSAKVDEIIKFTKSVNGKK
jgi:hypothetical protein